METGLTFSCGNTVSNVVSSSWPISTEHGGGGCTAGAPVGSGNADIFSSEGIEPSFSLDQQAACGSQRDLWEEQWRKGRRRDPSAVKYVFYTKNYQIPQKPSRVEVGTQVHNLPEVY